MIKNPGKFEGERDYAPHFYELMLNGDCEFFGEEGDEICVFDVTDEDHKSFPELGNRRKVAFFETEDGFWSECRVPEATP
jgi:hypothetical protein